MVQIPNERSLELVPFVAAHDRANDHPDESRIPSNPAHNCVERRDTVRNDVDVTPLHECQAKVPIIVIQILWIRGLWLIRFILCGEVVASHQTEVKPQIVVDVEFIRVDLHHIALRCRLFCMVILEFHLKIAVGVKQFLIVCQIVIRREVRKDPLAKDACPCYIGFVCGLFFVNVEPELCVVEV